MGRGNWILLLSSSGSVAGEDRSIGLVYEAELVAGAGSPRAILSDLDGAVEKGA